MTDIFDMKISCKKCDMEMEKTIVEKNGLQMRAVKCSKCGSRIIHPADLNGAERFRSLKGKTYSVKLRMVGNSHTVSIPKEIVNFMNARNNNMKRQMDDMVKLCLEDFKKLSLDFGIGDNERVRRDEEIRKKMENRK